jgi:hypothetical protein
VSYPIVSISGTLILKGDLVCTGSVIVENAGKIIPIANEVTETLFSCPIKDFVCSNGKSPTITSITSDINISGWIDGNSQGFPANFGPGANSTLLDNYDYAISFYGATHAGLGFVEDVPEEFFNFTEEFTLNAIQVAERCVILSHHPVSPTDVVMNIVHGGSQEYYRDFTIVGNSLSWRTPLLEPLISVGDQIRVIYRGTTLRIMPPPKPPYGSYEAPLSIGSGSGETAGGSGIRLIARSGEVNVSGSITMDGGNGISSRSGGASGGSIWIIGSDISGSGLLTAKGGGATYQYAGGGGGGYITLNYEKSCSFDGTFNVNGDTGATKGVVFIDKIEPFFIEKFTGHILNTKWWEIVQQPVILNNQVQMDTTIGDYRSSLLQSKFSLSGINITADLDYTPIGFEPSYHTAYFRLCVDDDNWVGISKRYGYLLGTFSIDGLSSQSAIPFDYSSTTFRLNKVDSTFLFQYVDSSAGPQTFFSQVLPEFESTKFFVRMGERIDPDPDATRKIDYFTLTNLDILNKNVLLTSMPVDASNVTLNILRGSSQYYGTDYYVDGQYLKWNGGPLDGYLQAGDRLESQYITTVISNDLNARWDNFSVFTGIFHDVETIEPVTYVDSIYGSDTNDGLSLTPLQNLFIATAWAKKGATVVLYDGTYNPSEVLGKTLTIMGAHGASPLITTDNVQDSTGSNWENSCLTFRNCQGVVKNISMKHAVDALHASNTHGLEIRGCTIMDSTTGVRFDKYSDSPKVLLSTIQDVSNAIIMDTQVYDPYVYSNVIYDASTGVRVTDGIGALVSSNTIDRVITGVFLDQSSIGIIASNNITDSSIGVLLTNDSTAAVYNNNFFGTIIQYFGIISDSSGNISIDPQYRDATNGDYHLNLTSPDRTAGIGTYDEYYLDRDNISRIDSSYVIGAYEIIDGTHTGGSYYVAGNGDDYRNFGTILSPYRTLDKAMSVADASIVIDEGHYDSYYLRLRSENININSDVSSVFTLDSHYSNIGLGNPLIYVSPNGSDSSVWGGDGTHTWGNGSQQYPYRSINRALQDASVAGTNLIVMSGEYEDFTGRQGVVLVPFSDRTGIPDGRYYLQSLFQTPSEMYTNHIADDSLWNLQTIGNSEASISDGFLTLIYDGTHTCRADSTFTFTPQFTVQAEVRQAFDPIYFSLHNSDNTVAVGYNNGDWTSTINTGGRSRSCWGHIDVQSADREDFFTDYVCLSSEDIANKFVSLTYLIMDATDMALNVVGGPPQDLGDDFYVKDGKIKWDDKTLEGELTSGEILRVIYKAQGLSSPVQFRVSLLPNGIVEVNGSDRHRWSRLMHQRILSDASSPWSTSFFMDRTTGGVDHSLIFGRGYVSKYFVLASGIRDTNQAVPYLIKTYRQPIALYNSSGIL